MGWTCAVVFALLSLPTKAFHATFNPATRHLGHMGCPLSVRCLPAPSRRNQNERMIFSSREPLGSFSPLTHSPSCVGNSCPDEWGANLPPSMISSAHLSSSVNRSSSFFRRVVFVSAALSTSLAVALLRPIPVAAAAAAAAAGEHLHTGQKIANFFRGGGLPDWATLMVISAMPVVELRGGVPVGVWMGMPVLKTLGLCVAGNMIPIPVILLALRSKLVQQIAKPMLNRARAKAEEFGDKKSQALALMLFVGIPLPGTGAWTGAMGASLLGMPIQEAMLSIFGGVVSAGLIMSALTLAGKAGALVATAALAVFCISNIISGKKGKTA
ncbi:unnamed protein product [Discosporangium mesarthrocarpum]